MRLSNTEIARTLELSHSTVSRMRTGERVASVSVLDRMVQEYQVDPGALLRAAAQASDGRPDAWVKLMHQLFDDGELEPES